MDGLKIDGLLDGDEVASLSKRLFSLFSQIEKRDGHINIRQHSLEIYNSCKTKEEAFVAGVLLSIYLKDMCKKL